MPPNFRLVVLGGLTLVHDGEPVSGALGQRKRLALLALLASSPGGMTREALVAMLWPDSDEERGRNSLAQAVHALRREIGEAAVSVSNNCLTIDAACVSSDLSDFRSAIAAGNPAAAVETYRGPFLDGVYLRDAPEFERWSEAQRAELERLFMSSLERLGESASREGDRPGAVDWWRRCASADPLSGRIARSYMEALAADGKREEAIRHSDIHAELVRAELGAEPDARVVALATELRRATDRTPADMPSTPVGQQPPSPNATPAVRLSEDTGADGYVRRAELASGSHVSRFRPRWAALSAAAILTAATAAAVRLGRAQPPVDRRVVVAAFENRTGDPALDQIGQMAADLIAQGLQRTNLMEVVDPAMALAASRSARTARVPLGDVQEIRAMAKETRGRLVVTGSYYREGDSLVMAARVSDSRDETLLDAIVPTRVAMNAATSAIEPVRERVMGALAMRMDERLNPIVPPGSSLPPTYTAYLAFMQGLEAHYRDRKAALEFYSKAAASDSLFVLPLLWKMWLVGASSPAGDSIVRRLAPLRQQLAPLERLTLDYQRLPQRDLRGKVAIGSEALRLAPGSHWASNVGSSLTVMGRFDEAVDTFKQIDGRRGWLRGWPTYWERYTVALHLAGWHSRELEIARQARRAIPAASLPVYLEARALAAMGKVDELNRVISELDAYKVPDDSALHGTNLSLLARELETSGDTSAANQLHERAIAWFATAPPDKRVLPDFRLHRGFALYRAGRYADCRPIFESLVRESPSARIEPNFDARAGLGAVYAYMGEKLRADSIIRVLLTVPGAKPVALHWSARISAAMGEKERAVDYLRQAVALIGRGNAFHYDNRDLDVLFDYPPYRDLLAMGEKSSDPVVTPR